jgi:hypothetical protein
MRYSLPIFAGIVLLSCIPVLVRATPAETSAMPSDDYSRILNIVGLVLNLAGILILFRWGMPFRVESHGEVPLATGDVDPRGLALDNIFVRCGWVGLILLIIGVILQIIAQLLPPTPLPPPLPGTNPNG